MSFVAVEVPVQTRANARPPRVSEAEIKELVKLLKAGKTPSDGELHMAKGKASAKTRAYGVGYEVRSAIVASGVFTSRQLSVRTWADGEGARWAIAAK